MHFLHPSIYFALGVFSASRCIFYTAAVKRFLHPVYFLHLVTGNYKREGAPQRIWKGAGPPKTRKAEVKKKEVKNKDEF